MWELGHIIAHALHLMKETCRHESFHVIQPIAYKTRSHEIQPIWGKEHSNYVWTWSFYRRYIEPRGSDHIFKNHCIHLTLWHRPIGVDTSFLQKMTPRSCAKPHCMHLFASGMSVDSRILVRQNRSLFSLLTFIAESDSAKGAATIDTQFCTNQNLESLVPMIILSCLSKKTLNSEPEMKFWNKPKAWTKAQTKPNKRMLLSKRRTHPPWVRTPPQHAYLNLHTSRWHTPLQRGVCYLQSGVRKVGTYPTNCSIFHTSLN